MEVDIINQNYRKEMNAMSKTNLRCVRFALLVMALELFSIAQLNAQVEKASFEIGIEAGPFLFITFGGREMLGGFGIYGEPHVGYFITDALVVGATGFFYNTIDSDPSQPSNSFGGAYAHVNYHFNSGSTLSPYIGGRIGVFNPDSETQFAFGIQTGLQYFVEPQLSINGQLGILLSTGSDEGVFLSCLGFGLSYHFR